MGCSRVQFGCGVCSRSFAVRRWLVLCFTSRNGRFPIQRPDRRASVAVVCLVDVYITIP